MYQVTVLEVSSEAKVSKVCCRYRQLEDSTTRVLSVLFHVRDRTIYTL
jgi:hypothetical protein